MSTIDWLPQSRIPEMQAFIDAHWRPGHILARDAQLLRWQHQRDDDTLSILVAEEGGQFVGMLGLILGDFNVRGKKLPAAWLAMWVIKPETKVGLELLLHAMRLRVAFLGVLGANETAMGIYRALKFTTVDDVPRMVRLVDAHALESLDCQLIEQPSIALDDDGLTFDEDLSGWNEAWQNTHCLSAVGTWRDAHYLARRYLSHPTFRYHVLHVADDAQGAGGCLVYRIIPVADHDACVVRIVELMGQREAMRALARHAENVARTHGAAFVEFYGTYQAALAACEAAGYVRESTERRLPSLFSPLDHRRQRLTLAMFPTQQAEVDFGPLLATGQLMVTRGDGDQDRPN